MFADERYWRAKVNLYIIHATFIHYKAFGLSKARNYERQTFILIWYLSRACGVN